MRKLMGIAIVALVLLCAPAASQSKAPAPKKIVRVIRVRYADAAMLARLFGGKVAYRGRMTINRGQPGRRSRRR